MAQNLDRFRTFPRLAGGKGPSPALAVVEEEAAEGLPPELGGSAGAEHSSLEPPPWQGPGVVQSTSGSERSFLLHSSCSKEITVCAEALSGERGCKGDESRRPSRQQLLFQRWEAGGKQRDR